LQCTASPSASAFACSPLDPCCGPACTASDFSLKPGSWVSERNEQTISLSLHFHQSCPEEPPCRRAHRCSNKERLRVLRSEMRQTEQALERLYALAQQVVLEGLEILERVDVRGMEGITANLKFYPPDRILPSPDLEQPTFAALLLDLGHLVVHPNDDVP